MVPDFFAKLSVGLQVTAATMVAVDRDSVNVWPFFLTGEYDGQVRCFLFYKIFNRPASFEEELQAEEITSLLEKMKENLRKRISYIFELEEQEAKEIEKTAQELRKKDILQELKKTHTPHEWGTVAEIAKKYNISKSEVRRRKADSTLHELLLLTPPSTPG